MERISEERHGCVIADFLQKKEAEVCGVVLEELSMEKYRQVVFEDGWHEGKAEGKAEAKVEERLSSIRSLMETVNPLPLASLKRELPCL